MADGFPTRTQKLTREQIALAIGNNPRAIRLFELLLDDVSDTIPIEIQAVADDAAQALQEASDINQSLAAQVSELLSKVTELQATIDGMKQGYQL